MPENNLVFGSGVTGAIHRRVDLFGRLMKSRKFRRQIIGVFELLKLTLDRGGRVLIFGNGGSAAEAQHFAAEFVCKFEHIRRALPAIALTTDSSILTAQSNDSGFETIFSRQIEALGKPGDLVIGFTTSDAGKFDGHSMNIVHGFRAAREAGCKMVEFFSERAGPYLLSLADASIIVPEQNTALIQEVHLAVIHILLAMLDSSLG